MSGIDCNYEIVTLAADEIKYYENIPLNEKNEPNLANFIAGDIVNEILENALDIATCASQTGINWKEIKDAQSNTSLSTNNNDLIKTPKDNYFIKETSNIVGDIIQNSKSKLAVDMNDISDSLNQQGNQGGIGDQLNDEKFESDATNKCITEPEILKPLGKKSRITNLVKNPSQLITEYLERDENSQLNQDEWEETEEQFLQIIELDHVKPGEKMFQAIQEHLPENFALPQDESDELDEIDPDDKLKMLDVSEEAFREEERLLFSSLSTGEKHEDPISATIPNQAASCGFTSKTEYKSTPNATNKINNESKDKKKKWNIGTRLWGLVKKGNKQKMST